MPGKQEKENFTPYLNYGAALMMDFMSKTVQGSQTPGKFFSL
jgi:hypothetical protein